MLFQVNDRIYKRLHLESVRTCDAAFCDIAVLDVECSRCSCGENVTCIPALDAAVQGNEARRAMCHICDHVFRMNFAVMNALYIQFQDIWNLIRCYELRSKGEEGREVLYDG